MSNITVQDVVQLEVLADLGLVVPLQLTVEHLSYSEVPLDRSGYMVDILGLDQSFQVVFKNLGEVVLQFGAPEVLEDFLPVGGILNVAMRSEDGE